MSACNSMLYTSPRRSSYLPHLMNLTVLLKRSREAGSALRETSDNGCAKRSRPRSAISRRGADAWDFRSPQHTGRLVHAARGGGAAVLSRLSARPRHLAVDDRHDDRPRGRLHWNGEL